jgi:hypothetical protein
MYAAFLKQPGRARAHRWAAVILVPVLAAGACAQRPKGPAVPATASKAPEAAAPAPAQDVARGVIDPEALNRLRQMSETLAAARSFSYRTRTSGEVPAPTGQFLTVFASTEIAVQRPDKVSARIGGGLPPHRIVYDGATLWAFDPQHNMYARRAESGGIQAAIRFLEEQAGIPFPAEDFLTPDPYASMTRNLESAFVAGPAEVDGHPTDHLAFMNAAANWEIWIDRGKEALPRRFAITFKDAPNFPRFHIEFLDWKLNPRHPAGEFAFTPPKGARQIDFATAESGEFRSSPAESGK